ncbi:MAG: MBL fold metallo-hydrolase [Cyclobacteriaceae bacterium]
MTVTFLGTGTSQGVPVIACDCDVCRSIDFKDKRLRTSVLIETDDQQIVIDTGPDFRQQMLLNRVQNLTAAVYTHQHKDHTAGMDDIRSFNFKQGHKIPIYARRDVMEQLVQEYSYVFAEHKYPGIPKIEAIEIENNPFKIGSTEIIPIEVWHHKLSVFGFRIKDFTYITDANRISEVEMKKAVGSKVLVLNALRKESHISHFTLDEAVEVAQEIGAEMTYLTHISHGLGKHRDVTGELPENIRLAYDGLKIRLN